MIAFVLLIVLEIVTYFVLLYRLAGLVRTRKPELFASAGGLHVEDFLVLGFTTGDSLISKLEANVELRREPEIARLMRWTRVVWFAQLITIVAGLFMLLNQ